MTITETTRMPSQLTLFLAASVLVAGLVFPPLSSYTAVYVTMGAMVLGGSVLWRSMSSIVRNRAYVAVIVALALLAVPLPFVWHGPDDLLIIVALLPVLFGVGLVALLDVEVRFASPYVIGALCLSGALGAVLAGLNDVYVLGIARAGSGNNPIHFADLTVTLGFFALVGLFGGTSRWRLVYLAGPLLGLAAIFLSDTRGAMLGFVIVSVPVLLLFFLWFASLRPWIAGGFALVVVGVVALSALIPTTSTRAMSAFADTQAAISAFMTEDGLESPIPGVDSSTDQRIALIRGAIGVFRDHPVFGVGAGQIIPAAQEHFPERYRQMGNHLHSDLGDFAAAAGMFGLAGYLALLVAPFLRSVRPIDRDRRRAILLGAVVLSACFAALGLTNALFGVLPQTALFGTLLATLVAMERTADKDMFGARSTPAS